ncbi:hypothetical protein XELAEV_18011554mg [Xenopus laevis]|uniref:SAM-dependent MTase RsmB/NOP-type domain-containing protein n=1 Tax=Xenopus laevis TaxID=8355 RepID=A0A974DL04_XENLA|nr:hypothetical protein XELAEV_18011554mg [Xenopus laevis]
MGRLQKQVCRFVLDYFDRTYTREIGNAWSTVREVLSTPECWQYAVLLNNFTSTWALESQLHMKGYHLLFQEIICPQTLKCFVNGNPGKFPSQRHRTGKLKEYYVLNAASLLPVLALDVRDGENVLDMCAAPGGKSIGLLQCSTPARLHCNEPDLPRSRWLKQTLESFVPETEMNHIFSTELDGRLLGKFHSGFYDKVLEVLRPGGSLVYSTCTLSRAENSDVISNILNSCSNVVAVDLSSTARALAHEFSFAPGVPHGLLVLPDAGKSWGPMFVAKLLKV